MSKPALTEHGKTPDPDPLPGPPAPSNVADARPRMRDFLAGLPAILVAVGTVLLVGAAYANRPTLAQYQAELTRRLSRNDEAGALVCLRRIVAMNPQPDTRFQMAILLAKTGAFDRAYAIARSLAPVEGDQPGYAPAHFWVAQRLLSDRSNLPRAYPLIERHLKRFIQASADAKELQNVRAGRAMLGELYALAGQNKEARPLLEETAGEEPGQLFRLARICEDLKDHDQAVRYNEAALKFAKARVEARPNDRGALLVWAGAAANLEKFDEAIEVLDRAFKETNDPNFLVTKGTVYAFWSNKLATSPGDLGAKTARRVSLIEKGLQADPRNADMLLQLSRIMQSAGAESEKAKAVLKDMLVEGKSPALVHFLLGNDAWGRKDVPRARFHWEEAYKTEPKLPVVANNLAYALAYHEPVDIPRALSLVDEGLKASAGSPEITAQLVGTRGQIEVKQEKWAEAVTDLEKALKSGQATPGIHNALADAYRHLGMADIADEHRKTADRLSASAPAVPVPDPSPR